MFPLSVSVVLTVVPTVVLTEVVDSVMPPEQTIVEKTLVFQCD